MRKTLLLLFALMLVLVSSLVFVACAESQCQHRDKDDNSLCDNCGNSFEHGIDLPGEHTHTYTSKNTASQYLATAADCENEAKYYYSCTCGAADSMTFSHGNSLGHDYLHHNSKANTCTEAGLEPYDTCSRCDYTTRVEIPPSHKMSEGSCTTCGLQESSNGLKFAINSDGKSYTVTGIGSCENSNIVIGVYNNLSVTQISDTAFKHCAHLTSITIPDGVTSISKNSFQDCTSLIYNEYDNAYYLGNSSNPYLALIKAKSTSITSLTIHKNTKLISDYAFADNTSLTNINIPEGVTIIGLGAFSGCTSLTSITIPDSVTRIYSSAFYNCENLMNVTLGDSITTIRGNAFGGCTSLVYNEYSHAYYLGNDSNPYLALIKAKSMSNYTIHESAKLISDSAFSNCKGFASITIPDSVTSIGNYAFSNCTSLENVTFGKSVTNIGGCAFRNCSRLTNVTIGNSVENIDFETFRGCTKLTSITIGNNVKSIGSYTFWGCTSLTNVIIRNGVASIGKYAFEDCTSLESIKLPDSITSIGEYAFYNCTSLASVNFGKNSKLKSIGDHTFENCTSLTKIDFSENSKFEKISDYAFNNCTSLTRVAVPDSVTSIGEFAFYFCSSLKTVTFGSNITSIGARAFHNCDSLTSVSLPDSLTSIGDSAFGHCDSLTSISIPDSVTNIGEFAFYLCSGLESVNITDIAAWCNISFGGYMANPLYFAENLYLNENLVTNLVIPEGVISINNSAFENYKSLTNISIPDSVTSIGSSAFYGCTSLESITLPFVGATKNGKSNTHFGYIFGASSYGYNGNSVPSSLKSVVITGSSSIGNYAFYGCSALTSITIPSSVTSIGKGAFQNCSSLESINFLDSAAWYRTESQEDWNNMTGGTNTSVTDSSINVNNFTSTYVNYFWYKKAQ